MLSVKSRTPAVNQRGKTFLLLDDNEDNRFLTGYALRKAFPGARVIESFDPDQALQFAQYLALDGVLTDHHLGARTGATFIRELRDLGVKCPVVMITASSDPAVHERAYGAGADQVFAGCEADFVSYFRTRLGS